MVFAILAQVVVPIVQFISITFQKVVIPLIPIGFYGIIIVIILTFCMVISGVGGSLLFYVLMYFYVKALLSYNPITAAREQALQNQQMQLNSEQQS